MQYFLAGWKWLILLGIHGTLVTEGGSSTVQK